MKNYYFIALLTILFSCSKDAKQPNPVLDCIGTVPPAFSTFNCEGQGSLPEFCRIEDLGTFSLEDSSKVYMPQFCRDTGSLLIFQNQSGDKITFKITGKSYSRIETTYSALNCPEDITKTIGYCLEIETLKLKLKAIDKDLELHLEITTEPDLGASGLGKVSDVLRITRWITPNSYYSDFSAIINQRTSAYSNSLNQQFFKSITLLGQNYTDVISNDMTNYINAVYTYYYTKQSGLIAFIDSSGILWKIED